MMVHHLLLVYHIMGFFIFIYFQLIIILNSHILAGTIKDTVTRYAHQTGHYVSRRFGWDCHGLPVEYEIDQQLGITHRDQVIFEK